MVKKKKLLLSLIFIIALTYLSASNAYVQASVTIGNGAAFNIGNSTLNVDDININGTLEATTGTINVRGNWTNNGTFTSGIGAVTFDSLSQPQFVMTGGALSSFKILNVENASASGVTFADPLHCATLNAGTGVKQLIFKDAITHTITFDFNVSGSSGNLITLASLTSGLNWTLNAPDGIFVQYLNISDSAAIFEILTNNCVDGGNNTNWLFDADGDWVADTVDNCPLDPNPGQGDDDGDGIGNVCDNCVVIWNPGQEDAEPNGIGDACDTGEPIPDEEKPDKNPGPPADPWLADDDGDGLTNGQEDANKNGIVDAGETDPNNNNTDGDLILDGDDNCPLIANSGQDDNDLDGIGDECDYDDDNDGFADASDNCPWDFNPNQADLDVDGDGDVCDTDADGDLITVAAGDCDDLDASVPVAEEIPNNGKDDDCNLATLDTDNFIVFTTNVNYDEWLPIVGNAVTVFAVVWDSTGPLAIQPPIEFDLVSVTNYSGEYTNHDSNDISDDYVYPALPSPGSSITVTSNDYGGSITLNAQAAVDLGDGVLLLSKDFTLPKDPDGDGLPYAWEILYGDLTRDGDIDTSVANSFVGDGLTNFEEYRGFMWGWKGDQLVTDPTNPTDPNDPFKLYKTKAFIPQGVVSYFRTHPTQLISDPTDTGTKDLFVKHVGYGGSFPLFAIGEAFDNAGIDVHALDSTADAGHADTHITNIDVLQVKNDLVYTYLGVDGHINKRGIRNWSWDTKGSSNLGTFQAYGLNCQTYQRSLDGYFGDKTYIDGEGMSDPLLNLNSVLDPINLVEDQNDNASNDRTKGQWEAGNNGILDGDLVVIGSYLEDLTAFDINNDGMVELPVTGDPNNIDSNFEYTDVQVLKHTITHEMGHAVGLFHNQVSNSLMYEYSTNWSRDDFFSDDSKGEIQIKHTQ